MSALIYPPVRDCHQRCRNCKRWSPHAVSVQRLGTDDDRDRRTVECLTCGSSRVE